MSESKRVNIILAGRTYPVLIEPEEESKVKDLERELNDMISSFQREYSSIDKLDSVMMTLITFAFKSRHSEDLTDQNTSSYQILEKIDSVLNSVLN
jgi:cell division protein ZapA (FtsZ GTPase activity inhibitor)